MKGLQIRLHGHAVGVLETGAHTRFRLSRAYHELSPRYVLGQAFEDDPKAWTTGGGGRLPPFFSNLLPEGALRDLIARDREVPREAEFELLAALGGDLPGALTAHLVEDASVVEDGGETAPRPVVPRSREGGLRFALSGVQRKLSVLRSGDRLIYPATGMGGDWIVKLPSTAFPHLPENELATMTWAAAAGIHTATHELLPAGHLENVPLKGFDGGSELAYVTRRFDRPAPGRLLHQEDFAQILDVYPDDKYDATNHETIASYVSRICGEADLEELVRRLVFIAISGNGDMHLKNWSLYYPDGIAARLAPAYDLVASVMYVDQERLALNLAKSKDFSEVRLASFERLARKIGASEVEVASVVRRSVDATLTAWAELIRSVELPPGYRAAVEDHMRRVPLCRAG